MNFLNHIMKSCTNFQEEILDGNRKLKKIDLDKASEIILDMKAIILAASIGSRLETLTNDKPNCMLNLKFQNV